MYLSLSEKERTGPTFFIPTITLQPQALDINSINMEEFSFSFSPLKHAFSPKSQYTARCAICTIFGSPHLSSGWRILMHCISCDFNLAKVGSRTCGLLQPPWRRLLRRLQAGSFGPQAMQILGVSLPSSVEFAFRLILNTVPTAFCIFHGCCGSHILFLRFSVQIFTDHGYTVWEADAPPKKLTANSVNYLCPRSSGYFRALRHPNAVLQLWFESSNQTSTYSALKLILGSFTSSTHQTPLGGTPILPVVGGAKTSDSIIYGF